MPTLDDVYRKFGEVSEAAQLLETELGTTLFFHGAVGEGIIGHKDQEAAAALLGRINRQTLGQLIKNIKQHTDELNQVEPLLWSALEARNRLGHSFYRQHNLRKFSDAGRAIMMKDLEEIHKTLLSAYRALLLISGIDLDEVAQKMQKAGENSNKDATADDPPFHLPL